MGVWNKQLFYCIIIIIRNVGEKKIVVQASIRFLPWIVTVFRRSLKIALLDKQMSWEWKVQVNQVILPEILPRISIRIFPVSRCNRANCYTRNRNNRFVPLRRKIPHRRKMILVEKSIEKWVGVWRNPSAMLSPGSYKNRGWKKYFFSSFLNQTKRILCLWG